MSPEVVTSVVADVNKWLAGRNGRYTMTDLNGEIICRIKRHYTNRGGRYARLSFLKNRSVLALVSSENKLHHVSVIYPYKDDTYTIDMVNTMNSNFKQVIESQKKMFNFDNLKNFKF